MMDLWLLVGVYGLAATLGFDIAARTRMVFKSERKKRATERRVDTLVSKLCEKNTTARTLRNALNRLLEHSRTESDSDTAVPGNRAEPVFNFKPTVKVIPLGMDSNGRRSIPVDASVRNIALIGIGLFHEHPIYSDKVEVQFQLRGRGESLSLVARIDWREQQPGDQYLSGGKLIDVITGTRPCPSVSQ